MPDMVDDVPEGERLPHRHLFLRALGVHVQHQALRELLQVGVEVACLSGAGLQKLSAPVRLEHKCHDNN